MGRSRYREDANSTVTSNGREYRLNPIFDHVAGRAVVSFQISRLAWVLEHTTPDPERVKKAQRYVPIIIAHDPSRTHGGGDWLVVDGLHRLARYIQDGKLLIPVKAMSIQELERFVVKDRPTSKVS